MLPKTAFAPTASAEVPAKGKSRLSIIRLPRSEPSSMDTMPAPSVSDLRAVMPLKSLIGYGDFEGVVGNRDILYRRRAAEHLVKGGVGIRGPLAHKRRTVIFLSEALFPNARSPIDSSDLGKRYDCNRCVIECLIAYRRKRLIEAYLNKAYAVHKRRFADGSYGRRQDGASQAVGAREGFFGDIAKCGISRFTLAGL